MSSCLSTFLRQSEVKTGSVSRNFRPGRSEEETNAMIPSSRSCFLLDRKSEGYRKNWEGTRDNLVSTVVSTIMNPQLMAASFGVRT